MADARILVVDDDRDLRATLAELLEGEGYQVDAVAHGREALEHLRAGPRPSLILLDLMMPVMSGAELRAEQLKDPVMADIPVAVMTATERTVEQALRLMPAAVIRKPVGLEDLLDTIARLVRGAPQH